LDSLVLVIVGGLNWGLVGINPGWNLVEIIFGSVAWLAKNYIHFSGLSSINLIYYVSKD
jgi:uncharacterized membrane protein YuzA (DUF378 family)